MPIFTAIGAAIAGALFGGSAIAAAVIAGGLALGARLAFSYLNRPKPQSQTAIRSQVRAGAGIDCATLYGEDKVLGQLLYYAKWGSGNSRNAYVYKLADGWCDSLAPYVFIFGQRLALTEVAAVGNEAARYTVEGYGSALVIRFYDGRPGQLADSELVSATAHLDTPWRSTSRGTNICYVVVDQTYDAGAYQQGLPTITFVLRGLREYDPRLDSTVAGGDGPQRLNDRSTWAFTQNNAVHRLNYLLGQKGMLSGEVMIGPGKTIGQIEVAMHMVAANVCDTERTVSGDTVPTYHCNQWVSSGDDQLAILKNIEDAMAGYAVNASGLDGVLAGAPQIPVREITAADIRADGQITTSNRSPVGQGFNALSGDYSCPETGFEPEGLKTVTVNADVVKDGGKRAERNDFPQVSNNHIAQYLLNIRYRQNRKAKRRALPVSRELGFDTAIGEWVTYEGLKWLVTNRDFDKTLRVYLRLAETGADIYDEEGIGAGPVVVPSPAPVNPSLISTVANFQAAAGVIAGENGAQRPALEFTWDDPEDPTINGVSIVYRKAGTIAPEYTAFTDFASSGKLIVDNGVAGDTSYEARATIRTNPDRFKSYTPWVTTVVATSPLSVILREVGADVYGTLTSLRAELDDIAATLTDLATSSAQGHLSNQSNIQDTMAVLGSAVALVRQETRVLAKADLALAEQITSVSASLGDLLAQGLFSIQAQAGSGEVLARVVLYARASIENEFEEAGMEFQVKSVGGVLSSQIVVNTDKLIFTNGEFESQAMTFEDGELKALFARFGAGVIDSILQTSTGKTKFGNFGGGAEGLRVSS